MAGSRHADIVRARDPARHLLHHRRRRVGVGFARQHQNRHFVARERIAPVEGDQARDRRPVGRFGHPGHRAPRDRRAVGVGGGAEHGLHHLVGEIVHRHAVVERRDPRLDEASLEIPVRAAEGGAGRRQHQGADAIRPGGGEFLRDHAAHRVPDQVHAVQGEPVEQPGERTGERRERHRFERRRAAVTRHVPRDRPVRARERLDLRRPARGIAADAVQEDDRLAAAGLDMMDRGAHASAPTSRPASTTFSPSRLTVQFRIGRSKCPSVWRPANSLAPVE